VSERRGRGENEREGEREEIKCTHILFVVVIGIVTDRPRINYLSQPPVT
jgi:hypothetical protein